MTPRVCEFHITSLHLTWTSGRGATNSPPHVPNKSVSYSHQRADRMINSTQTKITSTLTQAKSLTIFKSNLQTHIFRPVYPQSYSCHLILLFMVYCLYCSHLLLHRFYVTLCTLYFGYPLIKRGLSQDR